MFDYLLVFLKCALPMIAFYVAIMGIIKKTLYDSNLGANLWSKLTLHGKRLIVAALFTMVITVSIELISGVDAINTKRLQKEQQTLLSNQRLEEKRRQSIAETELRVALIKMTIPFRKIIYESECPRNEMLADHVGFEIIPFDPTNEGSRMALYQINLTEKNPNDDRTWGELIEDAFNLGIKQIQLSKTIGQHRAKVQKLLDSIIGDEFFRAMLDYKSAVQIWGDLLADQFEPNDRRDELYTKFWDTIKKLDTTLTLDETALEERKRMHPIEWNQILHDAEGVYKNPC